MSTLPSPHTQPTSMAAAACSQRMRWKLLRVFTSSGRPELCLTMTSSRTSLASGTCFCSRRISCACVSVGGAKTRGCQATEQLGGIEVLQFHVDVLLLTVRNMHLCSHAHRFIHVRLNALFLHTLEKNHSFL